MLKINKIPFTSDELKEMFRYKNGRLYWNISKQSIHKGKEISTKSKTGYIVVRIHYVQYLVSRIIYKMHNPEMDETLLIDHIDRRRDNNRIENLRLVDAKGNGQNRTKKSS